MPMTNIITRLFMRFRKSPSTDYQRRDEVMARMRNLARALGYR